MTNSIKASGFALLMQLVVGAACAQTPPMGEHPPPLMKDSSAGPTAARTPAGDGLGETVGMSATAGTYDAATLTYTPWTDVSTVQPLSVGAQMPAGAQVLDVDGKSVDLTAAVLGRPTILIFYRGGWCPYCNAHLRDLQASEPRLRELGYQIIAVSTDLPAAIRATNSGGALSYALYSDATLALAARFGLRYQVDERYIAHVKSKPDDRAALANVDLKAQNGGYLLTPGAFVLDRRGTIRFAYVNNNYAIRVKQDVLLNAARAALE